MTDLCGSERRDMFKAAAMELACQYGYEGATIKRIAQKCGVTVGTIYHYFENKEELFREALRERTFTTVLKKLIGEIEEKPIDEGLFQVATGFVGFLRERRNLISILVSEGLHNGEFGSLFADIVRQNTELMKSYFDRKIAAGELAPIDSRIAVQMFFGHFFTAYLHKERMQMEHLPPLDEAFVRGSIALLLHSWRQP
ncbi:transcription regulator, tetr family, putative [Heliomicrobium modesticaldum Ice1]|uniref:Transcription regulator, tetr family, putative n=1 Tax=Heliobacterium modesticaldum (strain ATCC 51547 / Ice1) TaxID=498761 RepID=B0TDY2_HELMI|nr:TetR/AcrR family transcriptional regulator [Heliomicrobium modesticaldum]ABZ82845.1 transcription regulator, tetr family, putative [Heliomicrobium modesticaldum Ice1]